MNTLQSQTCAVDLAELPRDLKRVLKVQFREFIHFVEDAQDNIHYYSQNDKSHRAAA